MQFFEITKNWELPCIAIQWSYQIFGLSSSQELCSACLSRTVHSGKLRGIRQTLSWKPFLAFFSCLRQQEKSRQMTTWFPPVQCQRHNQYQEPNITSDNAPPPGPGPVSESVSEQSQNSSPDSSDRSKLLLTEAWSNASMIFTCPRHQIEHLLPLPLERLYWPELINASNHSIFSNLPACSLFSKIALARSDLKLK